MNKHVRPNDFAGSTALKLVAVPAPGDTSTYMRLAEIEQAAYALFRHIIEYRAIPAHPENADYRARQILIVEEDMADMMKAIGNG